MVGERGEKKEKCLERRRKKQPEPVIFVGNGKRGLFSVYCLDQKARL